MAPTVSKPTLVIGLTGGIGSGKSMVANALGKRGAFLVDTDQISHQLTSPNGAAMPAISATFGHSVLTPDGALNRAVMRQLIFSNPEAKQRLEHVLHPLIRQSITNACLQAPANAAYVVIDIPLLFETGKENYPCQRILVVDCPEDVQIDRVMARNGFTRDQVKTIMDHQHPRADRLANADDVIHNDSDLVSLQTQIDALHDFYQKLHN